MADKNPPVLVEVTRGSEVESRHRGELAGVDAAGVVRHHLGDPEALVCRRSLAKPLQAITIKTHFLLGVSLPLAFLYATW